MLGLGREVWTKVWDQAVVASTVANDPVGFFNIAPFNLCAAFRVHMRLFTAGTVTVKLRFGFTDADALVSTHGIDFDAIAAANASSWAVQAYRIDGNAAVPPVGAGAVTWPSFSPLPPRVFILHTTAGATLTYEVFATYLEVP